MLRLLDKDGSEPRTDPGAKAADGQTAPAAVQVLDLATVYRQHARDVARWAAALLGPPWDIDDVVQDVFVVVQCKLPDWTPRAKLSTWLFEITRRVAMARRRRLRWLGTRTREIDEGEIAGNGPGPLELLEKREAAETVYDLLDKLPEKYRITLALYEIEELSGAEIAELTGTSLENVWVRLHRGRNLFAKRFRARAVFPGSGGER